MDIARKCNTLRGGGRENKRGRKEWRLGGREEGRKEDRCARLSVGGAFVEIYDEGTEWRQRWRIRLRETKLRELVVVVYSATVVYTHEERCPWVSHRLGRRRSRSLE